MRIEADSALAGIIWTIAAAACLAGLAVAVRFLSPALHPVEIVFFRSLFGLALLAPWLLAGHIARPAPGLIWLHAARALFEFIALSAWIGGIVHLPLGTAVAVSFTVPAFMVLIGLLVFGERFRWRALAGIGGGLAGVVVLARPEQAPFFPGIALMLTAAVAISASRTLIKALTRQAGTTEIVFYLMAFLAPISAVASLPVWVWPSGSELLLLVAVAGLATLAQVSMTLSYRAAAFAIVAPFDYMQLVFALLLGWIFFAELPSSETLSGALLIVLSALASRGPQGRGGRCVRPPSSRRPPSDCDP